MIDRWITKYVAIRYVRLHGGEIQRALASNTGRELLWLNDTHNRTIAGVEG